MEDIELVERALRGSQEAYREILRRYERPVFSLVLRMVRDRTVAEDLAQEAFVKGFSKLDTFDPKRKFSSWLFKIAHNGTIDYLRKQRETVLSLDAADDDSQPLSAQLVDTEAGTPEDSAHRSDIRGALTAAIDSLRPEYREVVVLRYIEGAAYQEISEITDLPLGTVKTYIHRARKQMATALRKAGWDESGPVSVLSSVESAVAAGSSVEESG